MEPLFISSSSLPSSDPSLLSSNISTPSSSFSTSAFRKNENDKKTESSENIPADAKKKMELEAALQAKMQRIRDILICRMRQEKPGESIDDLAKQNIITPQNLLLGYKALKISTEELFKTIERNVANPKLPEEQRVTLLKFTSDWAKSGLYPKDAKMLSEQLAGVNLSKDQALFVLKEGLKEYFQTRSKQSTAIKTKIVSDEKIISLSDLMSPRKGSFIGSITSRFKPDNEELFVEEINMHFFERFANVELSDVLEYASKEENPGCALHLLVDEWNNGSFWVRDQILKQDSLEQRQFLINFFLNCAIISKNKGCFFTSQMIFAALNLSSVTRLKSSFTKKSQKQIKELEEIFNGRENFKKYYEELSLYSNKPCLPALGIYTRSITFIKEGNPVLSQDETKYNLTRCNLTTTKIVHEWVKRVELIRIECAKQTSRVNLSTLFDGKNLMSEDAAEQLSQALRALEPSIKHVT